jgi:hypothetical protein
MQLAAVSEASKLARMKQHVFDPFCKAVQKGREVL